ncbi:MAG TPA: cation-transporting P-type ATPase, partial [Rhodanobacteraceae bacterium]|nr:cation-transporting P-type ATPase [Rhodanobacteraceae bacterium]
MSRSPAKPAETSTAGRARTAHARPVVADSAWKDAAGLLASLDATPAGLDEEQIEDRLDRDGVNQASHEKPPHWALQLAHTFKNPFIIVLLILAAVQLATSPGELTGPIIIAVMVAISVVLSFTQEFRSSRAAEKLKAMVRNTATVTRRASDGHSERIEVPVVELVAGD